MTPDSESTGSKPPAAARKSAVKKKTAAKKAVAKKKTATKKSASVKTTAADKIQSVARAALEQEAAVVHAAEKMQRRFEEYKQARHQEHQVPADMNITPPSATAKEPEFPHSPPPEPADDLPLDKKPAASVPHEELPGHRDESAPGNVEIPNVKPGSTEAPQAGEGSQEPASEKATGATVGASAGQPVGTPDETPQPKEKFKGRMSWKERKRERLLQRQAQAAAESDSDSDYEARAEDETYQNQGPAPLEPCAGMTEIAPKGFGFLRTADKNYVAGRLDVFVPPEFVRKYTLRDGMYLEGECRRSRRGPQMVTLTKINGVDPEKYADRPLFEELKAVNPDRRYLLETEQGKFTTRVIDMLAPIGRGQRGLIVAPPRTGKTTILEHIAQALDHNHPDVHVIVLLVDERPEEVTQMNRVLENAEIFSSSNDSNVKNHVRIAELAIERAKRLVEAGEHVVVLLDSITRLGRAYNNAMKGGGRTMSGGIDIRALELPRRLFAAARNTREGGSLTIIATALVETGSKMDELIFQEFKGTGNMELVLDRKIAQQYVYPAVDIFRSGTRREELLLPEKHLDKIYRVRRGLSGHRPSEAIERLLQIMGKFSSNAQMLLEIPAT